MRSAQRRRPSARTGKVWPQGRQMSGSSSSSCWGTSLTLRSVSMMGSITCGVRRGHASMERQAELAAEAARCAWSVAFASLQRKHRGWQPSP